MVSIITSSNSFVRSCHFRPRLSYSVVPSVVFEINNKRRPGSILVVRKICGFGDLRRTSCCCKGWESDSEMTLEGEILDFMKKSKKPDAFPTKEELMEAGRMDLVDGIVKEGGWLSLGWDLDEDNEVKELECEFDVEDFQRRIESCKESNSSEGDEAWRFEDRSGSPDSSSESASPSGRSLDMATNEDTGIEGILSRLEKQRNISLGIDIGINRHNTQASNRNGGAHDFGTSTDGGRANHWKSSRHESVSISKSTLNKSGIQPNHKGFLPNINDSRNSVKPNTWKTWSIQRAGSNTEFEAAEISLHENQEKVEGDYLQDKMVVAEGNAKILGSHRDIDSNRIRARLQHLELELSSALSSLRSKSELILEKGHESTPSDMEQLSDAWEFQETEIMNAQDKLRSIRAKLAVLEGKMTLAVIDAQKIVEEKQKRIAGAQRALQLLRSTCIIWPNSASEVLLAGSFDGWTTQRKMEKSRTGIFSVDLQLYPGRYEIKFIVDGEWRIDPLRPTVYNNGHENNILIIT